ncbi:hypothetical protein [Marinifilum sp. D714]|uniref:hypothetical protein n=1 Tax=Marinifilum sp. D714 TaxID=2937523 RepID=UPI0027C5B336|nr:hypothetical protein [Marinifilum sp. D714]MDQ2178692.1 hypothetical protein [Marinifilum sp. D714]
MRSNKILKEEIIEFVRLNQPVGLGHILAGLNLSHYSGAKIVLELIQKEKLKYSDSGKRILIK